MSIEIKHFYEFGPFRLDTRQQMLWREGEAVVLTLKSFELLKALVSRAGEVLSREELQELVWPESYVDENNLTQHISLLRKALGEAADARQFIETLPRRGYRFIAPVRELTEQAGTIVQQEEHIKARVVVEEPGTAPDRATEPRKFLALPAGMLKLAQQPVTWVASASVIAATLFFNNGLPSRISPARPLLLTTLDGQRGAIRGAQFSPDGKQVAWDRDGNLWLRAVGGERSLPLTEDEWLDECPVWSATGEQLAFVSNRGGQPGLWRIHHLGGTPTLLCSLTSLLPTPTAVRPRLITWRQSLWFEWDGELYRWQEGMAAAQKVIAHEAGQPTKDFAISADEQWLAYQAGQAQQGEIWQRKIAGSATQQLTANNIEDTAPLWHARGNVLLFNSVQQNIRQIWQTDSGSQPRALAGLPQNTSLRLLDAAPDGTGLLTVTSHNEADLGVLTVGSGVERVLTTQAGLEYAAYPAPQGETILFHQNQQEAESPDLRLSELWHWSPAQGAQATRLAARAFAPQWSPDGQQIAALLFTPPKSYDLQVMTAAGGAARVIARQLSFQGFTPRVPLQLAQTAEFTWLPDSQHIVYGTATGALKRIHAVTQTEQALAQLTGWQLTHPVVMATTNRLAWAGIRNRQEWAVWSMPLNDAEAAVVEPAALYATKDVLRLLGWRNETELLLALTPNLGLNQALPTEVRICTLSLTGELRELLRLPQVYLPSLKLAPDARSVVYVQAQQGHDVIGQGWLATGQARILLNNPDPRIFFASPSWSKDGQQIYFSRQRQSYRLAYLQNLNLN